MLRPLFSKVAGRLLALTSENYDGLARLQSETVWASQMSACALSSSVAESEQDKTMLQRVVMNRAWPKPSMEVSGLTAADHLISRLVTQAWAGSKTPLRRSD